MKNSEEIICYATLLNHKSGVNKNDWLHVHPELLQILDFVVDYTSDHDLPFTITSIIRPKIKGVSKSKTHEEGRAFDLSVRGWTEIHIQKLVILVNDKFETGAISLSDHKEREAVYEDGVTAGTAPHLHFQVRKC